ncbi:MAG: tetratricopeptide repeat protein [Candidatus Paceibacterota bacterium]|jgi:tetratricopeptide (TPR) repeat protein
MISAKELKYKINKRLFLAALLVFLLLAVFQRWTEGFANGYINEGNSKLAGSDYNGALRDYYYADKLDDGREISYLSKIRRGEIFFKFGKLDEAEKEFTQAIIEEKRRYEAYGLLGSLYYKKKDLDRAISFYNNAIQYNDGPKTKLDLGIKRSKVFMAKGEMDIAGNILRSLYSEIPEGKGNEELLYNVGLLEFDRNISPNSYLDEIRSSDEYGWKVREIDNFIGKYNSKYNNGFSDIMAASLYNSLQEPYLAINRAQKAVTSDESYRDAWIMLGKSHFMTEDYASSLDDLARALKLDGHNGETFFWLGSVFRKIGNERMASEYFGKYEAFK